MKFALQNFSVFQEGQVFVMRYRGKEYLMEVIEVQPQNHTKSVSVREKDYVLEIETQCDQFSIAMKATSPKVSFQNQNARFPQPSPRPFSRITQFGSERKKFEPFSGIGYTLSGSIIYPSSQ